MKRPIEDLVREHWGAIGRMDPDQVAAVRRLVTAVAMATYTKGAALSRLENMLRAEAEGQPWVLAEIPVPG